VGSALPRGGPLHDLALDATLRAAAPHQRARRASALAPRALHLERRDFRQKVREARAGTSVLFVVDASGSMAARRRMAAVKGAILSLLLDAYQKRDQVGLIAFRGTAAELILPLTGSIDLAEAYLRALPSGGRTPLAHALYLAAATLRRQRLARPDAQPLLVLVTDGRANVPLADGDALEDAYACAALLAAQRIPALLVDSEQGPAALGLARDLAARLGARYVPLEHLGADTLAGAVRTLRP
jgi:magnesium chelatase subunit D